MVLDLRITHDRREVFYSQLKSKVSNILTKTTARCIKLNIDVTPISSRSYTHPSHSQTSEFPLNLVSIFRCPSPPHKPVYVSRLNPSFLAFSHVNPCNSDVVIHISLLLIDKARDKGNTLYGCPCNERLKAKTEGSKRLTCTWLCGGLVHLICFCLHLKGREYVVYY